MNDKRKYQRLSVDAIIKYKVPEQMDISMASMKNISTGGVCLETSSNLTEGEIINLAFMLPSAKAPVAARGTVRWIQRIDALESKHPFLVGIEFVQINDERQQEIGNYIVERMNQIVREQLPEKKIVAKRTPLMLVIDDDKVVLKLVERIFKDNFKVITAKDGYAGIENARDWQPDIILLDDVMPMLDGFSTLMLLKDIPETTNIPVIMISGDRQKANIIQAIRHGASGYVTKPFTSDSLMHKIRKVLITLQESKES